MAAPTADQIIAIVGGQQLARGVVWRRPYYDKKERASIIFTRPDGGTSCATYFGSDNLRRIAAANKLRIESADADGDGIRDTPSLLLERINQNLILNPEDITAAGWSLGGGVRTANDTIGPDGLLGADLLSWGAATNSYVFNQMTDAANANQVYCGSAWLKWKTVPSGSPGVRLRIRDGAGVADLAPLTIFVPSALIWQRFYNVGTFGGAPAANVQFYIDPTDDANAGALWIADSQVEKGVIFPSSYIKSNGAALTRAADNLALPIGFGPEDITMLARVARPLHADVAGDLGYWPHVFALGDRNGGSFECSFQKATRTITVEQWWTPASSVSQAAAVPAGSAISICCQLINPTTAPQVNIDVGAGFIGLSAIGGVIPQWGLPTLAIGNVDGPLLNLIVARGRFTKAEMGAWLN